METARAWPSTEQSSMFMAAALREIARIPAAGDRDRGVRLAMAFQSALESHRLHLRHTPHGIEATRAYRLALRLRRLRHSRPINLLLTPLKPPVRAIRRYRVRRTSR